MIRCLDGTFFFHIIFRNQNRHAAVVTSFKSRRFVCDYDALRSIDIAKAARPFAAVQLLYAYFCIASFTAPSDALPRGLITRISGNLASQFARTCSRIAV